MNKNIESVATCVKTLSINFTLWTCATNAVEWDISILKTQHHKEIYHAKHFILA